ncbi:DUF2062 domain-containing protein [Leptolyngbya sp. FACHB-711]|uniref:DUF2062 domain-containing protein n=1 Tax=unclassified Leptolyngbya TaxID=2650499 RepID=UPI001688CAE6|nr:DUF2062 domain-containing protein [Leptolyngbya sp. FACHB-711]MBD1850350.1 DUF2062 domain-containing protein [Cyanobacteria bacterium FACHB-502]MBD2023661.1 DUF2062 domain-containing protein [Leptolyngbya sp. FACHB-711]
MRWKRLLRYFYLRFLRLRGTPPEIARGFAFGVFWGMFPLPGLQMAIAILTAAVFHSSKIAAAAGTWLSNPITTLPFTALNFHVGQTLLGQKWSDLPIDSLRSIEGFLALGGDILVAYLLGCAVVGFFGGLLSYGVALPVVRRMQKQVAERRHQRRMRKYRAR